VRAAESCVVLAGGRCLDFMQARSHRFANSNDLQKLAIGTALAMYAIVHESRVGLAGDQPVAERHVQPVERRRGLAVEREEIRLEPGLYVADGGRRA